MKALCTLAFAMEVDNDDDLYSLAKTIEDSVRTGLKGRLDDLPDGINLEDIEPLIDFYGATIMLRQQIADVVA